MDEWSSKLVALIEGHQDGAAFSCVIGPSA
jgi:hypothetical protein